MIFFGKTWWANELPEIRYLDKLIDELAKARLVDLGTTEVLGENAKERGSLRLYLLHRLVD